MNVLYFSFVDPSGQSGENHFARGLIGALAELEGVHLSVVCPRPAGRLTPELRRPGLDFHHLPSKRRGSLRWQTAIQPAMWKLAREAERRRGGIDAVVVSLRIGALAPLLFARVRAVPHILVLESHASHELRRRYPIPGARAAMSTVTCLNALGSSRVFAAYGGVQAWLTGMPGVKAGKIERFHHCVRPERFPSMSPSDARRELGLPVEEDEVVVGFVGSFKWYHRVDLLLEAARLLKPEGIRLLLVGDGPERNALAERSREAGLANSAIFTGNVDAAEVGRYISACDLTYGVIDPTHLGNPMKVYEYLAAGRVVIASKTEALSFVERIGAGILLDRVDVETLADAMLRLLRMDRRERLHMGAVGRRHVATRHTWEALARRIVAAAADSARRAFQP